MAPIAEGIWNCNVIDAVTGEDKGALVVRVNVEITDGPSKGRRTTYEDQVNGKSSLYIMRSCENIGWNAAGGKLTTLADDVAKWKAKTGGATTVEIRHLAVKKGKAYDKWVEGGTQGEPPVWDKANSLGRGAKPPLAKPSKTALADAEELMRRAFLDAGGTPPVDEPPVDEDIPFISYSHREPSTLARSVR